MKMNFLKTRIEVAKLSRHSGSRAPPAAARHYFRAGLRAKWGRRNIARHDDDPDFAAISANMGINSGGVGETLLRGLL